mmetsp:Transcript_19734/g.35053  ORF Transcript_19734/g.35053 Transcript_19734/m.35053 type:complete len:224 (+) Transcript_19734:82-753(+)
MQTARRRSNRLVAVSATILLVLRFLPQDAFLAPLQRALPAPPCLARRAASKSIETDDLSSLKVAELKQHLKDRDLSVGGNKLQLVERLEAAIMAEEEAEAESCEIDDDLEGCTVSALKGHLRARSLPVSGKKAELIERLREAALQEGPCDEENLEGCSVAELKVRLKEQGLTTSGRKAELIDRLQGVSPKAVKSVAASKSSKKSPGKKSTPKDNGDLRSLLLR